MTDTGVANKPVAVPCTSADEQEDENTSDVYFRWQPLFTNISPLLRIGASRNIEFNDCGLMPKEYHVRPLSEQFTRYWNEDELPKKPAERSVSRPLFKIIGTYRLGMLALISIVLAGTVFAGPLLMKSISKHQTGEEVLSAPVLWIFVGLTFAIPVGGSIAQGYIVLQCNMCAAAVRNSLSSVIFLKATRMKVRATWSLGPAIFPVSSQILLSTHHLAYCRVMRLILECLPTYSTKMFVISRRLLSLYPPSPQRPPSWRWPSR
jgi:hypothetical protein